MLTKPLNWEDANEVWELIQTLLKNYRRWGRFQYGELAGLAREQTCLEHVLSITVLARVIIGKLGIWHVFPDRDLLLSAFEVHDLGEAVHAKADGEKEGDVPYPYKTDNGDLVEFRAYCRVFGRKLVPTKFWLEAFLLQFCLKNPECFPEGARSIMNKLVQEHRKAALLFAMVEHLDYIAYGYREFQERRFPLVLVSIFAADHFRILDAIAREVDGVSTVIWTPEWKSKLEAVREEIYNKKIKFVETVLHRTNGEGVEEKFKLADKVLLGDDYDPGINHKKRLFCDMFRT